MNGPYLKFFFAAGQSVAVLDVDGREIASLLRRGAYWVSYAPTTDHYEDAEKLPRLSS